MMTPQPADPYTVVLGLGRTGLSCARFLARKGVEFVIVDTRAEPPGLAAFMSEFPEVPVHLECWDAALVERASELVISPGLSPREPVVSAAVAGGANICSDIDLFCREAGAPVIGITGSNAKSTVTTLLGNMAARAGVCVAVGGNLGTPALDLLDPTVELYVIELSSFQLEYSADLPLALGILLNYSPDHLDWHGSAETYAAAKQKIYATSTAAVFNRGDLSTRPIQTAATSRCSFGLDQPAEGEFGVIADTAGEDWLAMGEQTLLRVSDVAMVGRHNLANVLAALAAGWSVGLEMNAMLEEVRQFPGLRHRCELVSIQGGVRWVNDSKATNVGAALAAISGLSNGGKIILIAGGLAKGADFSLLAAAIRESCRAVVLLGEAAAELENSLIHQVETIRALSMAAAVNCAGELARPGDTVLLSPACASFDMFKGFADRGDAFCLAVEERESPA